VRDLAQSGLTTPGVGHDVFDGNKTRNFHNFSLETSGFSERFEALGLQDAS
jgi:hypothetical protein